MKHSCDYECAEANNCQVGGIECERCHGYFCAKELGEHNGMYVCDDCRQEIEAEVEEEMRMSSKLREALEKFCAIDLSGLKFPLDGDSSAIYNSDRKEITIPYWRVAELLNEVNAAQDMAKSTLAEPLRNCDAGTPQEQAKRFKNYCNSKVCKRNVCHSCGYEELFHHKCFPIWSQMPYESEVK